jgi:hypothetical protein
MDYLRAKNVELHLVGEELKTCIESPNIKTHGYVRDLELFYGNRDIHIAPIQSLAGVKNKVVGPLVSGLNILTTPKGANGLMQCQNLHIVATLEQFGPKVVEILESNTFGSVKIPDIICLIDQTDELRDVLMRF